MAKRDPEKTARNRLIANIKAELRSLLPQVLIDTGIATEASLNAKIGSKHDKFFDLKHDVIYSPDEFISHWMQGLQEAVRKKWPSPAVTWIADAIRSSSAFKRYLYLFLKRSYLKRVEQLSKVRPRVERAEMWIGQKNAEYGLLVTPRFSDGDWENDKSEIRAFPHGYWTIGHVMATGLVVPRRKRVFRFSDVSQYLMFFRDSLVRLSGSPHEYALAELYCDFVEGHSNPLDVPLLIPEFRYRGRERKHTYRLDFMVVNPHTQDRVGFELSPWSTHGELRKLKGLTQEKINEMAAGNFAAEMDKHRAYFRKYGLFMLIYTDEQLSDIEAVFDDDIVDFLTPENPETRISFQIMDQFS